MQPNVHSTATQKSALNPTPSPHAPHTESPNFNRSFNVGLDCVALPARFSGAAQYIYHLTRQLLTRDRDFGLVIFCKTAHRHLFAELLQPDDRFVEVEIRNRAHFLWFYERLLPRLLQQHQVDVFHAMHYLCPPARSSYKIVANFYDMGFLLYPQFYPWIKRLYFGQRMRHFLARADRIITISQATTDHICQLFPEYQSKISLVYSGCDHFAEASKRTAPMPSRKFMLAVNTFEPRKNIPFLIDLFDYLKAAPDFDHQFVIIGHPASENRAIQRRRNESPYAADIHIDTSVSPDDLVRYYRQADFFVNASTFEGFGFTPVEALQQNCPVFLYKNEAVHELFGDHPHLLDRLDVALWAKTIRAGLANQFSERLDRERIAHLTWQQAAQHISQIYHDCHARG